MQFIASHMFVRRAFKKLNYIVMAYGRGIIQLVHKSGFKETSVFFQAFLCFLEADELTVNGHRALKRVGELCFWSHTNICVLLLQFQYFLKDPVKYDVKYQVLFSS